MDDLQIIAKFFVIDVLKILLSWLILSTIFYFTFGLNNQYARYLFILTVVIVNVYILQSSHKQIDPIIEKNLSKVLNKLFNVK